jgi:hypothetical protein
MIIKSKARKSIKAVKQLLEYVMRQDALYRDESGRTLFIRNNIRGHGLSDWCREFSLNEASRVRKMKGVNAVYHEILSWHELDREAITLTKLEAMAREYIRLRNPNALVLAVAHQDKGHVHIHFVISGVEKGSGKSLRISKEAFRDMKLSMEQYQRAKFPELEYSKVNHKQSQTKNPTDKEYQIKLKGKISEKEKLMADVNLIQQIARTEEQFIQMLQEMGYRPYYRNGRFSGVESKRRYRIFEYINRDKRGFPEKI